MHVAVTLLANDCNFCNCDDKDLQTTINVVVQLSLASFKPSASYVLLRRHSASYTLHRISYSDNILSEGARNFHLGLQSRGPGGQKSRTESRGKALV